MNLEDIKLLKKQQNFIIILEKLKLLGLNDIFNFKEEIIDYIDVAIIIIDFLNKNKDVYKNLNKKDYENLIILCLYDFFKDLEMDDTIIEICIENILKLLKTNLSINQSLNLHKLLIMFYNKIKKLFL